MQRSSNNIASAFGCVLKQHRLAAGLSQEALSFEAQIDRTFVSMLERGLRVPTLGVVLSLAGALNVSAAQLVEQVEKQLTV